MGHLVLSLVFRIVVVLSLSTGAAMAVPPNEPPELEQTGDTGQFLSPNYPRRHPPDQNLTYTAHLDTPGPLLLRVRYDLSLEKAGPTSCHDYVRVQDKLLCGTGVITQDIQINGSEFVMLFYSDDRIEQDGFNVSYYVVPDTEEMSPSPTPSFEDLTSSTSFFDVTTQYVVMTQTSESTTTDGDVRSALTSEKTSTFVVTQSAGSDETTSTLKGVETSSAPLQGQATLPSEQTLVYNSPFPTTSVQALETTVENGESSVTIVNDDVSTPTAFTSGVFNDVTLLGTVSTHEISEISAQYVVTTVPTHTVFDTTSSDSFVTSNSLSAQDETTSFGDTYAITSQGVHDTTSFDSDVTSSSQGTQDETTSFGDTYVISSHGVHDTTSFDSYVTSSSQGTQDETTSSDSYVPTSSVSQQDTTTSFDSYITSGGDTAISLPILTRAQRRCRCVMQQNNTIMAKQQQDFEQMVTSLTLKKDNISTTWRRYESVPDSRRTAQAMGVVGIVMCVLPMLFFLVTDIIGLCARDSHLRPHSGIRVRRHH